PEDAALGSRRSRRRVDADAFHWREIDHEAAIVGAVAGRAVAAAPPRHPELARPGEVHRLLDVGRAGAAGNERRLPIDVAVPDGPRRVVVGVSTPDQLAT